MSQINNMHSREECPGCHHVFVSGYDSDNRRRCPSCKKRFISGQIINHGDGCSICAHRMLSKQRLGCGSKSASLADCPPLMSDGRFITYYNSSNDLTEAARKINGIRNPNEFRTFMQNNGDKFINAERNYFDKNNRCRPTVACSDGWCRLWTKNKGNWANQPNIPLAWN